MHAPSPRHLVPGHALALLALLIGCTGGEETSSSSFGGSFSASQASQVSTADPSAESTATGGSTGATGGSADSGDSGIMDPTTTGQVSATEAGTTGAPGSESGPVDPTTTDADPSTTTGVDPSTTTGVDPSTTTGVDPSTTTGDETTDEPPPPPPPPPKDPQPANGLYEHCLDNNPCEPALTDGCFTITDSMTMKVIDGYCTILCANVNDCGPKPNVPATQECLNIAPQQNVCALRCKGVADCPTGMACTNLSLPNNQTGMFCT